MQILPCRVIDPRVTPESSTEHQNPSKDAPSIAKRHCVNYRAQAPGLKASGKNEFQPAKRLSQEETAKWQTQDPEMGWIGPWLVFSTVPYRSHLGLLISTINSTGARNTQEAAL